MKISVLCLADYYLPGFKGGGPIRTLANMRELLSEEVDFSIFTRDRDLGTNEPYPGISRNKWVESDFGRLFYATPNRFSAAGLREATSGRSFDILYLNSFFSYRASIAIYLDQRKNGGRTNILIAPRGEFSPGALALKRFKKRAFLAAARLIGLYRDVHWHASSPNEAKDILRQFPHTRNRIHIAEDPVSKHGSNSDHSALPAGAAGILKIAFISRVSPMKNLDGLIKILNGVQRQVELSIFGPIEDVIYWNKCLSLIDNLPENVTAAYCGLLRPEEVAMAFAEHDIFAFPTHGENFGHVIFEALQAGTSVLVSDQTHWKSSSCGAISVIPLNNTEEWQIQLEAAANHSQEDKLLMRKAALEYAEKYIANDSSRLANMAMFRDIAKNNQGADLRKPAS